MTPSSKKEDNFTKTPIVNDWSFYRGNSFFNEQINLYNS